MTRQSIQQPSLLKVYKVELDFFYINVLKTLLQKCLNQPLDSPIDLSQVVKSVMRMAFGRTGFVIKLTKIRMIIGKENIKSFFKSIVVYRQMERFCCAVSTLSLQCLHVQVCLLYYSLHSKTKHRRIKKHHKVCEIDKFMNRNTVNVGWSGTTG